MLTVRHGGNGMKSLTELCGMAVIVFVWALLAVNLYGQQLSSSAVNFGGWPVDVTSTQDDLAFKNTSGAELTISLTISGGPFAIPVNDCGRGVKPNTHCNIFLTYTPEVLGEQDNGIVTFSYVGNGANGSVSATLAGTGTGPFATGTDMSFGPQGSAFSFFTTTYSPYQIPLGETILNTCTNQAGTVISYAAQITSQGRCKKGGCEGPYRAYANWTQPIQEFEYGSWSCQGEYTGDKEFAPSSGVVNIVEQQGQPVTVLHNFTGGNDGGSPMSNLIFDSAGNLYGTTEVGGLYDYGTVYELSPNGNGGWNQTVLYSFTGGTDGAYPTSNLIFDNVGNLYGTAGAGPNGDGVVFELSPAGTNWTETVLYSMGGEHLITDQAGNFYGTNSAGVFELSLSSGVWKEQAIYNGGTFGGLAMDNQGNIFFVGPAGRRSGGEAVELSPNGKGGWNSTVVHTFPQDHAGHTADGTLVIDKAGNLYGFTDAGNPRAGESSNAAVFRLQPTKKGKWTLKNLYVLKGAVGSPFKGITLDGAGDIYVVGVGTNSDAYGAIFELTAPNYTESAVWNFNDTDGSQPYTGLTLDNTGNLYGTTYLGGSDGYGVVFELTP
jgi:uncharacterized repeat protein (TIGR03803 family)